MLLVIPPVKTDRQTSDVTENSDVLQRENEAVTRPRSFGVGDSQGRVPKGYDFQSQDTNIHPSSDESDLESGGKPDRGTIKASSPRS